MRGVRERFHVLLRHHAFDFAHVRDGEEVEQRIST